MSACKSLSFFNTSPTPISKTFRLQHSLRFHFFPPPPPPLKSLVLHASLSPYSSSSSCSAVDSPSDVDAADTVEDLLHSQPPRVHNLMKMERKGNDSVVHRNGRFFPYLDRYLGSGSGSSTADEVISAIEGSIQEARKEKIRRVVANRSYSVSLVVEGLTDLGNVSAAFRSADALGIQSVHVVSQQERKRYRDNRHVSRGAEKWLDIELWKTPAECFDALRRRGYRIATTWNGGVDTVSVYDMDWSLPTAIVVGNENKGVSHEALALSDLHCFVPMNGMVDSFNVSVAAGILMHHAVADRISRLGAHGDLTHHEKRILVAEFFLRHRETSVGLVEAYGRRKDSSDQLS